MVPLAEIERKICKASIVRLRSLARLSEFQVCAMDVLKLRANSKWITSGLAANRQQPKTQAR